MELKGLAFAAAFLVISILLFSARAYAGTLGNTSSNTNSTTIAINLTSELNNSLAAGYNFTKGDFQSNSSATCVRALITRCDNNNPSQFVCLSNSSYNNAYLPQRQNISNQSGEAGCPEYMLAGVVGCGTQNGYCVVIHEQYQLESNATTIYHATTSQPTTTVPVNVPVVGTSTVNGLINQIIQFFNELFKKL